MGLDIIGKKTGDSLSFGYSKIHHFVRAFGFYYFNPPVKINEQTSNCFYMYPYIDKSRERITVEEMQRFIVARESACFKFPNLMLHSDCHGKYTKNGKVNLYGMASGNSVQLLKELDLLVNDVTKEDRESYKKYFENGEIEDSYLIDFYNLVKNEVKNGCGTILFR